MENNDPVEKSPEQRILENYQILTGLSLVLSVLGLVLSCASLFALRDHKVPAIAETTVAKGGMAVSADMKSITVNAVEFRQLTEENEKLVRIITALVLQSRDGGLKVPVALVRDPSPYGLFSEAKNDTIILTVKARK